MAIYNAEEAKIEAVRMVQNAIQNGLLAPASPNGFSNPADAGKKTAEYLGGLISNLATQLAAL